MWDKWKPVEGFLVNCWALHHLLQPSGRMIGSNLRKCDHTGFCQKLWSVNLDVFWGKENILTSTLLAVKFNSLLSSCITRSKRTSTSESLLCSHQRNILTICVLSGAQYQSMTKVFDFTSYYMIDLKGQTLQQGQIQKDWTLHNWFTGTMVTLLCIILEQLLLWEEYTPGITFHLETCCSGKVTVVLQALHKHSLFCVCSIQGLIWRWRLMLAVLLVCSCHFNKFLYVSSEVQYCDRLLYDHWLNISHSILFLFTLCFYTELSWSQLLSRPLSPSLSAAMVVSIIHHLHSPAIYTSFYSQSVLPSCGLHLSTLIQIFHFGSPVLSCLWTLGL